MSSSACNNKRGWIDGGWEVSEEEEEQGKGKYGHPSLAFPFLIAPIHLPQKKREHVSLTSSLSGVWHLGSRTSALRRTPSRIFSCSDWSGGWGVCIPAGSWTGRL